MNQFQEGLASKDLIRLRLSDSVSLSQASVRYGFHWGISRIDMGNISSFRAKYFYLPKDVPMFPLAYLLHFNINSEESFNHLRGAHFEIRSVCFKRLVLLIEGGKLCHVVMPPGEISMEEDEEPKARQFMTVFENFRSESAAAGGFTL